LPPSSETASMTEYIPGPENVTLGLGFELEVGLAPVSPNVQEYVTLPVVVEVFVN
jgi:hypothetical protein